MQVKTYSLDSIKRIVGWVNLPQPAPGPIRDSSGYRSMNGLADWGYVPTIQRRGKPGAYFPFPVFGPRTNLTGSNTVNGYSTSGGGLTGAGTYCSSDTLSAGLYQIDYILCCQQDPAAPTAIDLWALRIFDRGGNNVTAFALNLQSQPSAITNRLNIPVSEGQKILLTRDTSNGLLEAAAMMWTFLSPYLGNTPLSLAARGVQATEPRYAGQATTAPTSPITMPGGGGGGDVYTPVYNPTPPPVFDPQGGGGGVGPGEGGPSGGSGSGPGGDSGGDGGGSGGSDGGD